MLQRRNLGALISCAYALANTAATAGGSGDNTEIVGPIIDLYDHGTPGSAVLAVSYSATLAEGETLSIAYSIDEGADAALADEEVLQSAASAVVATGPSGGGTVRGVFEVDVPVRAGGRYVRANVTPDLSAANTDTATIAGLLVFGGADRLPVT